MDQTLLAGTGGWRHPIKTRVEEMFDCTGWLTGAAPDDQRPKAYILVLHDSSIGGGPAEQFAVADPSDEWTVHKDDDGVVRLGKLGQEAVLLGVL